MYFDLEDLRPETPSVPRVISVREAVLLSLLFHACLVIAILVMPDRFFGKTEAANVLAQPDQIVRFVQFDTPKSLTPPKPTVVQSDMDRRPASPVIPPKPQNPDPVAHGNTDDKTIATPNEKMRGPDSPNPNAGAPPQAPQMGFNKMVAPPDPNPGGGMLGQALRNIDRYTQGQSYDNSQGGQDNSQAQIQFDSKGVEFGPWLDRFLRTVKHNWLVPEAAWSMHGHVVIRMNIYKNGTITDIQVLQPSSIQSFNTAAVNALKMSSPVVPLPAAYPVDPMVMTVTFFYNETIR
jgi:TonB family protein